MPAQGDCPALDRLLLCRNSETISEQICSLYGEAGTNGFDNPFVTFPSLLKRGR